MTTHVIQTNTFQPTIPQGVLLGSASLRKPITIRNRISSSCTANGSSLSGQRGDSPLKLEKKRVLTLHKPIKEEKCSSKKSSIGDSLETIAEFLLSILMLIPSHFNNLINAMMQLIQKLKQKHQAAQNQLRSSCTKQFTLVLDLDETLIHSTLTKPEKNSESVYVRACGAYERIFFQRRPHLDVFLQEMSQIFNLVVFTASQPEYADAVLDSIDKQRLIMRRYYRDSCSKSTEGYIKCLDLLDEDLSKVILLDNAEISGAFNRDNLLLIKPWYSNEEDDDELLKIGAKLKTLESEKTDLRRIIKTLMNTQ